MLCYTFHQKFIQIYPVIPRNSEPISWFTTKTCHFLFCGVLHGFKFCSICFLTSCCLEWSGEWSLGCRESPTITGERSGGIPQPDFDHHILIEALQKVDFNPEPGNIHRLKRFAINWMMVSKFLTMVGTHPNFHPLKNWLLGVPGKLGTFGGSPGKLGPWFMTSLACEPCEFNRPTSHNATPTPRTFKICVVSTSRTFFPNKDWFGYLFSHESCLVAGQYLGEWSHLFQPSK